MSYYRRFAAQTLKRGLKQPYVYLVSALFSFIAVLVMRKIGQVDLPARTLDFLGMAIIFNGFLPLCFISIYLCALPVFFVEKKQKTLTMLFCSPAGLGEILWGKTTGLVLSAFIVPLLFMLVSMAVFTPHVLASMASWKALAAIMIVAVTATAYTAIVGTALLTAHDDRVINIVVFALTLAQFWLTKLTQSAAGKSLFSGVLFQYAGIMCGFIAMAAAAYFLYLSKIRVVESA